MQDFNFAQILSNLPKSRFNFDEILPKFNQIEKSNQFFPKKFC